MQYKAPVRKSLLRNKIAWLGGDRRLVGFTALVTVLMGWTMFVSFGLFWGLPIIVPSIVFLGILWVARQAYAADPWMLDVLMRQNKYRRYYAPKSSPGVKHPRIRDFS